MYIKCVKFSLLSFIRVSIFCALLFCSVSCSKSQKQINVITPPLAANLSVISSQDVVNLIESYYRPTSPNNGWIQINVEQSDSQYSQLTLDYLNNYVKWFNDFIFNFNFSYRKGSTTCAAFGDLFSSLKFFACENGGASIYNTPCIARLTVIDINDFGNVPGDKSGKTFHCLDLFIMNNKVYVIEPQDLFPTYVELKDYPNKGSITNVSFY